MLKFWIEFFAIILIGFFGAVWTVEGLFYDFLFSALIFIVAVFIFIFFVYYQVYHKKTTDLIRAK